jgi:flagellum-specific ATP synthase
MPKVVSKEHLLSARRLKQLYSRYMRGRDLVSMGAYIAGTDPDLDAALQAWPRIQAFLQQDAEKTIPLVQTEKLLFAITPPVM